MRAHVHNRTLLVAILVLAVALLTAGAVPVADGALGKKGGRAGGLSPKRPNVVILLTDDQTARNFTRRLMPNVFRRVVDKGVTFSRGYVSTPLCCPSRAQVLTGLLGRHNGVGENSEPLGPSRPTIAQALDGAGYRTMLAGKYLNSESCDPHAGWDRWICSSVHPSSYTLTKPLLNIDGAWRSFPGYTTDILANQAARFIKQTPSSQPFFVLYSPPSPHRPANDSRAASLRVEPHRPPSYDEDTTRAGKPEYLRRAQLSEHERARIDHFHRVMTQALPPLDRAIGSILDAVDARGDDNTLVVFLSDNGYMYGEHRRMEKHVPYEEAIRVPFAVRFPALVKHTRPFRSSALVANIDIAPTIAHLAGIRWRADGRSLVPLLTRRAKKIRDSVVIEYCTASQKPCNPTGEAPFVPSYSGIVTATHKVVSYVTGERELYDLARDPHELRNLAGRPEVAAKQSALSARLAELTAASSEATIVAGPEKRTRSRTPTFLFFTPDRSAKLSCRLLGVRPPEAWHDCRSGVEYGPLSDGSYVFQVRARNGQGPIGPTASRGFSIRTRGPRVTVTRGPSGPTNQASPTFAVAGPKGALLQCRLLREGRLGAWQRCGPSSLSFPRLPDGNYTFEARARTRSGSVTDPPAFRRFQVDTQGPRATFEEAPPGLTADSDAAFEFRLSVPSVGGVSCALDGGAAQDCSAGAVRFEKIGDGRHTLTVAARDVFGQVGRTDYAFIVDTTSPRPTSLAAWPSPFSPGAAGAWKFRAAYAEPVKVHLLFRRPEQPPVFERSFENPEPSREFAWNGIDDLGHRLPAGAYLWVLRATDLAGNQFNSRGMVTVAP